MKYFVFLILVLCALMSVFTYADTNKLYSVKFLKTIEHYLPENAKFYIDDLQESGDYYFVTVVEYYDNKPPLPHLFVFDVKLNLVKDIVVEDFSYHRDLFLEDLDGDKISDVVLMTGTGANSNRGDVFLNKLRQEGELDKVFFTTGNHTLRFYVAKNKPTIEIGGEGGISSGQRTVLVWDGKTFIKSREKK